MRRRLIVLSALVSLLLGGVALSAAPSSAAALGKTGVYKDACGMNHVWVNGQDLGPQYLVCIQP